jgi:RNA exonuclease 4
MKASAVFCVDVECAATSKRHSDRTPISVALSNQKEDVLVFSCIKPKEPVFSYLTPLTGVTEEDVLNGRPFVDIVNEIRQVLRGCDPLPLLVGNGIENDIRWLELVKGEDFSDFIDLAEMFKAWNPKYGQFNKYSLAHLCKQLLGATIADIHCPKEDAVLSVRLYNRFKDDKQALDRAKNSMVGKVAPTTFVKKNNYRYEGVCMAAYYPEKCSCDAPTKK